MNREYSCCFTGHRPEKLPWRANEEDARCHALKARLAKEVALAYAKGYRHFISGMARGTDLYFCEAVLDLQAQHPDITLEAAIPYPGQAERWPDADKHRYHQLLNHCHFETVVQHHYSPGCLQRRNRYLVDHASLVISVYNGKGGGTMNTLAYAMAQGVSLVIIDI